ncbi:MFS general substrate transporter [Pyronema omphalodes]|nr:MFS general substrate transporter [Pyronema omphalodes]
MEQPTNTRFNKASSVESATVSGSDAQAGLGLSSRIPLPGAIPDDTVSPTYAKKAHVLNAAIQEIGMGRYQWGLFFVAGFGWCADNLWPQTVAIILPTIILELNPPRKEYLALSQSIGLCVGASFWGIGSDIIGRRWAFNLTLLITSVFGLAAGWSPTFAVLAGMVAMWSVGVGGNLPVDSAVFLEFLPASHQYLLTVMSVWWSVGQIIASAVAWPLIGMYSCPSTGVCTREMNMGWRYFLWTMGGFTMFMFIVRFFVFDLYEAPKWLMGRGDDEGAAAVVDKLAAFNRTTTSFSISDLQAIDAAETAEEYTTTTAAIKRNLSKFSLSHIRALFSTPSMAKSTSLIMILWFLIGLAFLLYNCFLPYFLTRNGVAGDNSLFTTYRNYLIIAVMNVPGSLIGGIAVEVPGLGRKGSMCAATTLTGVFLFLSTTSKTSNALLGWNCAYAMTSNMMYGILYAYTPEVFPTKDRGTGNGLASTANRIGGILAPVIAMYANIDTPVPIYVAASCFVAAGVLMLWLPYESRGKGSL